MSSATVQGLRTVVYFVEDLAAAATWYARMLEIQPHFDTPYYVGFNVGGYELGLHPLEGEATGAGGTQAYWGVPDVAAAYARLIELGAEPHKEIQDVGEGIKLATVRDPWGNIFGVIENPHFRLEAD